MSVIDKLRALRRFTQDSWVNLATGVGASLGKLNFTYQERGRIPDQILEAIYAGDPFAAKAVDAYPDEALRKPFTVNAGDPAVNTAISMRLDEIGARPALREAWVWARLYGGSLLWVGADDGQASDRELNLAAVRSVRFLSVFDRTEVQAAATWDPGEALTRGNAYMHPKLYRITPGGGGESFVVHASRVIRFDGVLTSRRRRAANMGWSDSVMQRVYDRLQAFNGSLTSAEALLNDASQGVLSIKDLDQILAGDVEDLFKKRMVAMEATRSIAHAILVNADGEAYSKVETSLAGLPDALQKFFLVYAGACGVPVTVLMSQSTSGLNANGDSDIETWYGKVSAEQENYLRHRAEKLVRVVLRAQDGPTRGAEPATWKIEFAQLKEMTQKETSEIRASTAQTDSLYIQAGVLTPEEVATSRFRPDGWSMETAIETGARDAAAAADRALASGDVGPADAAGDAAGDAPVDPHAKDPTAALNGAQVESLLSIVTQVTMRQIPRETGIQLITAAFPVSLPQAESIMGEVGKTFFVTPPPDHEAALTDAKSQLATLQRSHASTKVMLARVIERNKAGELVVGNLIAKAPTDTQPGDVLQEGDTIPADPADVDALAVGEAALPPAEAPAPAGEKPKPTLDHFDAADVPTGVIIALQVPAYPAQDLALPGGEPAADLHITLAYLGQASALSPETLATIRTAVATWAASHAPMRGVLGGHGRFLAPDGSADPVYLSPDVPDLAAAREALVAGLTAAGVTLERNHGFVPHVTLAYVPKGVATPALPTEPVALTFTEVGLWVGPSRESFALAAPPARDGVMVDPMTEGAK